MEKVVETIKIEKLENDFFKVVQGDRYSERLGYDEMLGLVSALTIPKEPKFLSWLKTKEEHEASRVQSNGLPSGKTILVPEEIGIYQIDFKCNNGDRILIKINDSQLLGYYMNNWIVNTYQNGDSRITKIQCKLLPCKREDLKPGDTAFSNLLDDKNNLSSYCKVIDEGQVAHISYYRDKPGVRVSIWNHEPSLQWYKVVPV